VPDQGKSPQNFKYQSDVKVGRGNLMLRNGGKLKNVESTPALKQNYDERPPLLARQEYQNLSEVKNQHVQRRNLGGKHSSSQANIK